MSKQRWQQLVNLRDALFSQQRSLTGLHASHTRPRPGERIVNYSTQSRNSNADHIPSSTLDEALAGNPSEQAHTSCCENKRNTKKQVPIRKIDPTEGSRSKRSSVPATSKKPPLRREDLLSAVSSLSVRLGAASNTNRKLPASPYLDPKLIGQRTRWKRPKPVAAKARNDLQLVCEANPFARMLASPVRVCPFTDARLPIELLTPYVIMQDPRTEEHWQVPANLHLTPAEQRVLDEVRKDAKEGGAVSVDGSSSVSNHEIQEERPEEEDELEIDEAGAAISAFPSKCWISTTYETLDRMGRQKPGRSRGIVVSHRWRHSMPKSVLKGLKVRTDNAHFTLSLMRDKAVVSLARAFKRGRINDLITAWPTLESDGLDLSLERLAQKHPEALALDDEVQGTVIIWLGSEDEAPKEKFDQPMDFYNERFAAAKRQLFGSVIEDKRVSMTAGPGGVMAPILNGPEILGEERLQWLRRFDPVFRSQSIAIRMRTFYRSSPVWLWRLHLFIDEKYREAQKATLADDHLKSKSEKPKQHNGNSTEEEGTDDQP